MQFRIDANRYLQRYGQNRVVNRGHEGWVGIFGQEYLIGNMYRHVFCLSRTKCSHHVFSMVAHYYSTVLEFIQRQ